MNRSFILGASVALGALSPTAIGPPAFAQVPITTPPVPSVLTWTPEQQAALYPAMESVYETRTVRRGDKVRPLPFSPQALRGLDIGLDGETLDLASYMERHRMSGVLAIRDGKIILEAYGLGRTRNERWTSFSVAKSVTSTLVGAAIAEGKIASVTDPVVRYLPELAGSAYEGVTVEQVLSMTSGVRWNEDYTDPKSDVARAGAQAPEAGVNPIVAYMAKLPREAPPGEKFVYKTGETDLAGVLLSRAVGMSLSDYLSRTIWSPYGMAQDAVWMVDSAGHERGGCCMSMTLRDYGRFAQFMLDDGVIDGRRVLPEGWVARATTNRIKAPAEGDYGYFWWTEQAPNYRASGIFGQQIAFFPDDRLIVVINSAMPKATDRDQSRAIRALFERVRAASAAP